MQAICKSDIGGVAVKRLAYFPFSFFASFPIAERQFTSHEVQLHPVTRCRRSSQQGDHQPKYRIGLRRLSTRRRTGTRTALKGTATRYPGPGEAPDAAPADYQLLPDLRLRRRSDGRIGQGGCCGDATNRGMVKPLPIGNLTQFTCDGTLNGRLQPS